MFTVAQVTRRRIALIVCLLMSWGATSARAQFEFPSGLAGLGGAGGFSDVSVSAEFTPAQGQQQARLSITAVIPEGFHIYAIDQGELPDNGGGPMATALTFDASAPVKLLSPWQPDEPPHTHIDQVVWTGLELREHTGQVTWTAAVEVTAGTASTITGNVAGQACNPQTCIPFEQSFSVALGPGAALPGGGGETAPEPTTDRGELAPVTSPGAAYDLSKIKLTETANQTLSYYLIIAFLGGLILNIMPCVLPVIGLKVMSFVQQAGQSRAHAWALNCWYSAGIVAVFLVLATLVVSFQLTWGGHFSNATFNIVLIGIVFAMALSLLGMWEIPIPGFIGGGTAMQVAEREGPTGAFLKGVLTTLLATPCIGPFVTPALTWAIKQPVGMTYSMFAVLGIGMASPYLLIGAFPALVKFLPKPGPWMETFKKICGFTLLATVVWLMNAIAFPLLLPTVLMLLGISLACWWVSRVPVSAGATQKFYAWTTVSLLVLISVMGSYGWLYQHVMLPRFNKLLAAEAQTQQGADLVTDEPWQPFTLNKLAHLTLQQGRTVIVDFTADWCATCKVLEKFVLKTDEVEQALSLGNVVSLEADFTQRQPAMEDTIKALGGIGVPLVAIFPASDPYVPTVFADGNYTKADLIEAISEATGQDASLSSGSGAKRNSLTQAAEIEPRR